MSDATAESSAVTRDGIEVAEGRLGRGVFALQPFSQGDVVEVCPTLEVPDADVGGLLGDYAFSTHEEGQLILLLGFGMLYNHSPEPNVEYVEDGPRTIAFVALRDIEPGEELTIDYGEEWWETRELEPA
jgi:SET domain-containing protein